MAKHILIIDDEPNFLRLLSSTLSDDGYNISTITNPQEVIPVIEKGIFDLIITDFAMPELNGKELMQKVHSLYPGLPIIIITGVGTIEIAVEAMRKGAYDFITKPFELDRMRITVKKALEHTMLCKELNNLRNEVRSKYHFNVIGESIPMKRIFSLLDQIVDTNATIIIQGESGTGKEVLAKAIHYKSQRKNNPFMPIDCGALTQSLLESELFGHIKGAFTGAYKSRAGLFETAKGGTIFLDEIQNVPLNTQIKLLRVLQEKEVKPLGSDHISKGIDVRLIAATQNDLSRLMKEGKFRQDLYYRLKVFEVEIPPLRKRRNDIPLLISHFIGLNNKKLGKKIVGVDSSALEILYSYDYPGNVRELKHIIERAVIICKGKYIKLDDLQMELKNNKIGSYIEIPTDIIDFVDVPKNNNELKAAKAKGKRIIEKKIELMFLHNLLSSVEGSVKKAALKAGMNRSWLSQLVSKYKIDIKEFKTTNNF